MRTSAYTHTAQHPLQSLLTIGLLGAGAYLLSRSSLLARADGALRARWTGRAEVEPAQAPPRTPAADAPAVDDAWLRPSTVGAGAAGWVDVE